MNWGLHCSVIEEDIQLFKNQYLDLEVEGKFPMLGKKESSILVTLKLPFLHQPASTSQQIQ
jgi:hypothetical protein